MNLELEMARRLGMSTAREFKALKRAQTKEVVKAMDDLGLGCAGSPAYEEIAEVRRLLTLIRRKQSAKVWGR